MSTDFDPDDIVRKVTERLATKHPKRDRGTIETMVRAQVDELKDRPIHDYVSVLAERAVKQQLKVGR